ncbi:unnamed protein product, partial [Brachionus calyciflorus]
RERSEWIGTALENIDERVIGKLSNFDKFLYKEDGYEQLIRELNQMYFIDQNSSNRMESLDNFKTFFERNQGQKETLESYANSIKTLVKQNFPNTQIETFEEMLKQRFVDGLFNPRLREKYKFNGFDDTPKAESDSMNESRTVRLTGKAIFNNTLVSYIFDTGAGYTIINKQLYARILHEEQTTILKPYKGKAIWSCNKKLKIFGVIYLKYCQITHQETEILTKVPIIVTNHSSRHECLLGRDLMKKVPYFEQNLTSMEQGIKFNAEKISKRHQFSIQTFTKQNLKKEDNSLLGLSKIVDVTVETGRRISQLKRNLLTKPKIKKIINFNQIINQTIDQIETNKNLTEIVQVKTNEDQETELVYDSFNSSGDKTNSNESSSNEIFVKKDNEETLKNLKNFNREMYHRRRGNRLGFTISRNQIKPNPNRAKCLMEKPKPKNIQELQCWLGIANGYRTFIEGYAQIVKPLYDLMGLKDVPKKFRKKNGAEDGKKVEITWNNDAETSFENLKEILCSKLVLALPNFNKPMHVIMDMALIYDFQIEYIPGEENIVADSFSMIPDNTVLNVKPEEEYQDNLVALIENNEREVVEETAVESPENNPKLSDVTEIESYKIEQANDKDIVWMIELIKLNGQTKPLFTQFKNLTQRLFFKQYEKFRLIEGILYRVYENENGLLVNQYVLPSQSVKIVV